MRLNTLLGFCEASQLAITGSGLESHFRGEEGAELRTDKVTLAAKVSATTFIPILPGGLPGEGELVRNLDGRDVLLKEKVGLILMNKMFSEQDPLQMTGNRQKGNRLKAQSKGLRATGPNLLDPLSSGVSAAGLAEPPFWPPA